MARKILITDDSGFSRKALRRILENQGYEVAEATDGMNAIELFMMESPEAVFLDLTMPGLNGLEVISKLKHINPAVPIIIASADIQESTRKMALELGATVYLHKPFNEEIVRATLSKLFKGNSQ